MSFEVSEEELSSEGVRIAAIMPELELRISKLNEALDNRVAGLINEGKLTPELALAYWYERNARRGLVRQLITRVIVSNSAGKEP